MECGGKWQCDSALAFAVGRITCQVAVFDLESGMELLHLPYQGIAARVIQFSPDDTTLAIRTADGHGNIWQVPERTKIQTASQTQER